MNLPVRTVVVEERPGSYAEPLTPAQILNALGRAGRACIETAGWAILARHAAPSPEEFARLSPSSDDLEVKSVLATHSALLELTAVEEQLRTHADSILDVAGTVVANFISYVWLALWSAESLQRDANIDDALNTMLFWSQLTEPIRHRWRTLATQVKSAYDATEPATRARWVRTPTSLCTARRLDELAAQLATDLKALDETTLDPVEHVTLLYNSGVLKALMQLPEAPQQPVYNRRAGKGRAEIPIDLRGLLDSWLQGVDIADLASTFFVGVENLDYRYEQLSDYLTSVFEHHLAWTTGLLIDRVNRLLSEGQLLDLQPLSPQFSSYVRHGVANPLALQLLSEGVRSRKLAHAVSTAALLDGVNDATEVRAWLLSLGHGGWAKRFHASAADMADLMAFVRDGEAHTLAALFEGLLVQIPMLLSEQTPSGPIHLQTTPTAYGRMVVVANAEGQTLAPVPEAFQADLRSLVDVGLPYTATMSRAGDVDVLSIQMAQV